MKPALRAEIDLSRDSVLGIMDFGYAPYALGDTMTWLTNLQITAHEHGLKRVDVVIVARPEKPAGRLQPMINSHNYIDALENIFPAFMCAPLVSSIRIYERFAPLSQRILGAMIGRSRSWPGLVAHFRQELDYSSHRKINRFFHDHGYIPRLEAPRGYRAETEQMRRTFLSGRNPIVVNVRRRGLTNDPASLNRDSRASAWGRLFTLAEAEFPSAVFVVVGGYSEWERELVRRPNIFIPRAWGYGLGHELDLLLGGTPFMGTSSGFSAAATFSETPYVITNFEHQASRYIDLPVGTEKYPFAIGYQRLNWQPETEDILIAEFRHIWNTTVLAQSQ